MSDLSENPQQTSVYSDGDDQNKHVLNILDDYSIKHHEQDNSFDSGESEFPNAKDSLNIK
jgi:hypothetical protein